MNQKILEYFKEIDDEGFTIYDIKDVMEWEQFAEANGIDLECEEFEYTDFWLGWFNLLKDDTYLSLPKIYAALSSLN